MTPQSHEPANEPIACEEARTARRMKMPHVPVLDGLRAIAVGIVFVGHSGLQREVPGGLGVTIFFFLSGYLITSLLRAEMANTGGISLANFYTRRILRIFPPLYITLTIVLLAVMAGVVRGGYEWPGVAVQYVHLTNYAKELHVGTGVPYMAILWSLAIEEHFYLLFPLSYKLFVRRASGRGVAIAFGVVCLLVLGLRVFHVLTGDIDRVYFWTHTRIDAILFGCCLAMWHNPVLDDPKSVYRPKPWHFALAVACILGCVAIREPFFRETARYTIQSAALFVAFAFILHAKGGWIERFLTSTPMQTVGVYSYTFYLVHVPLINLVAQRLPAQSWLVRSLLALALTLAYCALMHRFVEKPLARLRARLHARALAGPTGAAPGNTQPAVAS